MSTEELYRENIIDHYKSPHNFGKLDSFDIQHKEFNPTCGDEVEVFIKIDESEKVKEVKFRGQGCAISQASASLLTDAIKGKSLEEIKKIKQYDIMELLGITVSVTRLTCALLSLKCLIKGVEEWEKN